jgi:hypothetical protein
VRGAKRRDVTETPATYSRVAGLEAPRQVVTGDDIDTGLAEEHPKEPTAHYHDGTVYLVCVSWNAPTAEAGLSDKRPALFVADGVDDEFEQVSVLAASEDVYEHAAAVTVHDDRLYVLYSVRRPDSETEHGNDIHLKHTPVGEIPARPEGWVDEGVLVENARDPGLFRVEETWYLFFSSEGWRDDDGVERVGEFDNVGRVVGDGLHSWTDRTDPVYSEANDQAADVVPAADGSGYWLVVTASAPGHGSFAVAGWSERLDGQFSGRVPLCQPGRIGGTAERWFATKTTHFDYCKRDASSALYAEDGRVPAYFEGRPDGPYSVGVAFAGGGQEP